MRRKIVVKYIITGTYAKFFCRFSCAFKNFPNTKSFILMRIRLRDENSVFTSKVIIYKLLY